jgi:hypothetical protein
MSKFATPQSSRKPSLASSSFALTPAASLSVPMAADGSSPRAGGDDDASDSASSTTPMRGKRGRAQQSTSSSSTATLARSKSQSRAKRARTPSRTPARK